MSNTKHCRGCGTDKPVSAFNPNKTKRDGLQTQCRECRSAYNRLHYSKNADIYKANARISTKVKKDFWVLFKSVLKCSDCGEDHPATLEFHHTDPTEKEYNVAQLMNNGYSEEKVRKEVEKCIVLCSNCHRKLHWTLNSTRD